MNSKFISQVSTNYFDHSKLIVYNLENILLNIFYGLKLHFKSFKRNNFYNLDNDQSDLFNEIDDQTKFDALFLWLSESYSQYKMFKESKTIFDLKLNTNIFREFPQKTKIFFFSKEDQYLIATALNDNLFLNRLDGPMSSKCNVDKNTFFENFVKQSNIKTLKNGVLSESTKLEKIFFDKIQRESCERLMLEASKLNKLYEYNLDFVIFCFKLLEFFSQETCYFCWTLWLNKLIDGKSTSIPNSRIMQNFFNKLKFIDQVLSQQIFAYVLFFSIQNLYIEPNSKIKIKWNLFFPNQKKDQDQDYIFFPNESIEYL